MASKHYSPETRKLLDALSRRTVAYHPDLATALGSIPAAIILGQLLYWHGKQADKDGWIMKTAKELEAETAVTERQQENVRQILVSAGAVKFERRHTPAMPFYKIDHDRIVELYIENDPVEIPPNVETEFPPRSILKFPPNRDANTEITTETTTEKGARPNFDAIARAAGMDKDPPARRGKEKAKKAQAILRIEELEAMPAVKVHRAVLGMQPITLAQMEDMVEGVNGSSETTWRPYLETYKKGRRSDNGQPWNMTNVEAQLRGHASYVALLSVTPKAQQANTTYAVEEYDV